MLSTFLFAIGNKHLPTLGLFEQLFRLVRQLKAPHAIFSDLISQVQALRRRSIQQDKLEKMSERPSPYRIGRIWGVGIERKMKWWTDSIGFFISTCTRNSVRAEA